MDFSLNEIGQRIKNRRLELKLTQTNIKEMTGISSGNMSDIENGKKLPSTPTLIQLSNVLNCTVDYILTGKSLKSEESLFPSLSDEGLRLLEVFYALPDEEQEELLFIAELKFKKLKRDMTGKSSLSKEENTGYNIA